MKVLKWLTVNADGDVKVTTRAPSIGYNEVAYKLWLHIPHRLMTAGEIELHLPQMPVPELHVEEYEPEAPTT